MTAVLALFAVLGVALATSWVVTLGLLSVALTLLGQLMGPADD